MKRFFLFVTVSCCLHAALSAQPSVGLSSGVHWANRAWYFEGLGFGLGYRPAPGARVAGVLDWPVSKRLGVRAEAGLQHYHNYLEVTFEDPPLQLSGNVSDRLRAWTVSVLLTARPFRFRWLYFSGGLSSAYLIEQRQAPIGKLRSRLPDPGALTLRDTDLPDYQRYQMLADVGAGISLPLSERIGLLSEVRYQHGLRELELARSVRSRLSAVGVNVGLTYALKP